MKIYVGNLSWDTGDADLRDLFAPYGEPDSARVIVDRDNNRSKGFGFVEFSDNSRANAAIAGLNGKDFKGRTLTVNEARPRTEGAGSRRNRY